MTFPTYFESKKSLNLYELNKDFEFLKNLYNKNKLPKAFMLSGKKGSGKATLINHLLYYIFDTKSYNLTNNEFNPNTDFYNLFLNNVYENLIYLSGSDYRNIKIEDIRNLKKKIFQSSISDKPRFIILDDVELFNNNSLNALLKIVEEPTKNNFFILINNESRPLIDTIKSRCLNIKIILNEKKRLSIILSLVKKLKLNLSIEPAIHKLTPGQFIKFNHILSENKIALDGDFLENLGILLNLFKKNKEIIFIDLIMFITDIFFNNQKNKNLFTNDKIIEYKSYVFENINKFFLYNLNQNSLLNAINNKINVE